MRTFVRLLPRLLFLGLAAAALLVLAGRERSAHADAPPQVTAPAEPALPPLSPPPAPTPLPTDPLPAPEAAALPAPTIPGPALPAITAPSVAGPAPPGLPTPPVPALPIPGAPGVPGLPAPDLPAVDPGLVTGAVGPLPAVPEVSPPEPLLPELPEIPEPALPGDGVLELSAAPPPGAPAPADALDRAPSAPVADPGPSHAGTTEGTGAVAGIDVGLAPARGPPTRVPGSPHPCPGGGSPHPTRADPAAFLAPGADDASRRAGLLAEARSCASALLRDPLLRPD